MSFILNLFEETKKNKSLLESMPIVQAMLSGNYPTERYIKLLKNLYPIVLNFCPIMASAASRCGMQSLHLQNYLYAHIHEEKRHEEMVLKDLSFFDIAADEIIHAPLSYPVQAMISYNYHMQDRSTVCSVLGMIYVLEVVSSQYGDKVALGVANRLKISPDQGFSFLMSHSSMDVDHMSTLQKVLELLIDKEEQRILMDSVRMNFYFIAQIIQD